MKMSYLDVVKAMAQTWYGIVALLLGCAVVIGTFIAFATGNWILGIVLLLASIFYWIALYYLMTYVLIFAMIIAALLRFLLPGIFNLHF
jgi:hypothetical protein